jgi:hypothetical protein
LLKGSCSFFCKEGTRASPNVEATAEIWFMSKPDKSGSFLELQTLIEEIASTSKHTDKTKVIGIHQICYGEQKNYAHFS